MTDRLSKNFHGVGIGPLSKILAVNSIQKRRPNLQYDYFRSKATSGKPLPGARVVSTTFRLPATDIKSPDFTNLLVGFGQFLSHDNEFTPITRKKSYLQPAFQGLNFLKNLCCQLQNSC